MKLSKFIDNLGELDAGKRAELLATLASGQVRELETLKRDLQGKKNDKRRKKSLSDAETAALEMITQILSDMSTKQTTERKQETVHAAASNTLAEEPPPTPEMIKMMEQEYAYARSLLHCTGSTSNHDELYDSLLYVENHRSSDEYKTLMGLERTLSKALQIPGKNMEDYADLTTQVQSLLKNLHKFTENQRLVLIMASKDLITHERIMNNPAHSAKNIFETIALELAIAAIEQGSINPKKLSSRLSLQNCNLVLPLLWLRRQTHELSYQKNLRNLSHRIIQSEQDDGNTMLVRQLHYLIISPQNPLENVYFETSPIKTTGVHSSGMGESLMPTSRDPSHLEFTMQEINIPTGTTSYIDDQGNRIEPPMIVSEASLHRTIESQKIGIVLQNDLIRELKISCPEVFSDPAILAYCPIIRKDGKLYLVHFDEIHNGVTIPSNLQRCSAEESENVVGLSKRNPADFGLPVVYHIPTLEDVENRLFSTQDVQGRYNPEGSDESEHERMQGGSTESPRVNESVPRLESLVKVLLTEGVTATFAWDKDGKYFHGGKCDYTSVQPDHYVIVTTDRGVRIVISNDQSKGTVILKNTTITAEEFVGRIQTKDLIETHGGTPVHYHSSEQFERALRTVIPAKGEKPKIVYPLDTNGVFRTPLDDGEFDTLMPDFEYVAGRFEKQPWELNARDFAQVRSGEYEWTYGGPAHGDTFLNRLARDFGLNAVKEAKKDEELVRNRSGVDGEQIWRTACNKLRREFADNILGVMLREIYPEASGQTSKSKPSTE